MPSWEHALGEQASDALAGFLAKFLRNVLRCQMRNCTCSDLGRTSSPFLFPTHWSVVGLAAYWSSKDHFSFKCFWCLTSFAVCTPHCRHPTLPCKALPLLHLHLQKWYWVQAPMEKDFTLCSLSGLSAVLSPSSSSTASGLACHHNPGTTKPAFWPYSFNSPLEPL